MKVILSRKGFDSQYGGYPSPILPLPDGRMISLPIPSIPSDIDKIEDKIKYSNPKVEENLTYYGLMEQLGLTKIKNKNKSVNLTENTRCHFDPDINDSAMERKPGWKQIFGQIDTAQTHLKNQGVKEGDLFLFFGTFRKTIKQDGKYQFDSSPEFHAIYGYLQIGEIIRLNRLNNNTKYPEWMDYHPHTHPKRLEAENNTIYVARGQLTWQPDMPGAGVLSFTEKLILTKKGYSKSRWDLLPFFKEVEISYNKKGWKDGYFQSAGKGQEFVIQDNEKIENWVKYILKKD